jgi:UDP-GlcNAc:undecaprenyl-phosphate GlcNAc-1-phosphate transferase
LIYLFSFFIAAVLALTITPRVIRLCSDWGILDHPDQRKLHESPMPLAGGITLFPFALIGLTAAFIGDEGLFFVLFGTTLIFGIGLWDDRFGSHFLTKFLVQTIAALSVMQAGILFDLNRFVVFKNLGVQSGHFLSFVVTIFWIVGIINAVNLIDGMDGLASGLCLNAFIGMGALAIVSDKTGLAVLCLVMSGALLGFLRYNIHPAKTFLGDSGSLLLGFILAVVSITHSAKTSTFLVLVVPILLLAIPLADTVFAFVRRLIHGESPFKADREHLHHRLMALHFTPMQTLGLFYGVSAVLGVMALWFAQTRHLYALAVAVTTIIVMLGMVKGMQILNLHSLVVRLNDLMQKLAKKAVSQIPDSRNHLARHFTVLAGLLVINLAFLLVGGVWFRTLFAGSLLLFVLGGYEVVLNLREKEEGRYSILSTAVFLSLIVNQLIILTVWHRDYLVSPHYAISAFLLLVLLSWFLYRTGTFAIFLQDPIEILALFMGMVIVAVAKHSLGGTTFLPFAVILANALVLKILLKVFLTGYKMRSWVHSTGFAVCVLTLVSVPWLV